MMMIGTEGEQTGYRIQFSNQQMLHHTICSGITTDLDGEGFLEIAKEIREFPLR